MASRYSKAQDLKGVMTNSDVERLSRPPTVADMELSSYVVTGHQYQASIHTTMLVAPMPRNVSTTLRPARVDDLNSVHGWIDDAETCRRWASANCCATTRVK